MKINQSGNESKEKANRVSLLLTTSSALYSNGSVQYSSAAVAASSRK